MSERETCRVPGCGNEPGEMDGEGSYRYWSFCSERCEVKYEHIEADARDARIAERRRMEEERPRGV